jgi:hypothetical protein
MPPRGLPVLAPRALGGVPSGSLAPAPSPAPPLHFPLQASQSQLGEIGQTDRGGIVTLSSSTVLSAPTSAIMSVGVTMQDIYVSEEQQWEANRATITRLYCKDGKTLKQVMAYMEQVHFFFAT